MKEKTLNWLFAILMGVSQIVAIIFYGLYFKHILPTDTAANLLTVSNGLKIYGFFQDIHVMIYVGFGFLLTSFHRFRLSSLVMCFWVAGLAVQYYFLFNALWIGVFHKQWHDIRVDTAKLIYGEVSAGAALIAVCAIIGKTTSAQYVVLTLCSAFLYTLNEVIVTEVLKCRDIGGAMIIHTFGAFYGIGLTTAYQYKIAKSSKNLFETHESLTSAMIGTLFLWCFWPSFNAALGTSDAEINMAVLNTYFSIIGSVLSAYATSVIIGGGRFTMSQILNATLAGGVAMGSCADILYDGWVAYLVGNLVGIISTLCFKYCPPLLDKCGIHDVAGVFNLHGIPGLISGFLSAIFRARYIDNKGGNQAAGTVISWAIGLFGGLAVGYLTKRLHDYDHKNDFFNDKAVVALEEFVIEELEVYGHPPLAKDKSPAGKGQSQGNDFDQDQGAGRGQPIITMEDHNRDQFETERQNIIPEDETIRQKPQMTNKVQQSPLSPLPPVTKGQSPTKQLFTSGNDKKGK